LFEGLFFDGLQEPWFSRALVFKSFAIRAADRAFVPLKGKSALLLAAAQSECGNRTCGRKSWASCLRHESLLIFPGGAS